MSQHQGPEAASDAQSDPRRLLVDAIRMLEQAGIVDHSGHCSIRRDGNSFFINSGASVRGALTRDDIVAVDLDGNLLEGAQRPPLEFHIHAGIYRARPDVGAVAHTHPKWSTYLSMTGHAFRVVYAQASLLGDVPVMDSPLSVNTRERGEELAALLGAGRAVLLKAHGATIVGADMLECFALAVYLEENAERLYRALLIGEPYVFSAEEQRICRRNLGAPNLIRKAWDHYRSKLPR
jgi:L-fuculose-phosphate aldolase